MNTRESGRKPVRNAQRPAQPARRPSASAGVAAPPRPKTTQPARRPAPRSQKPAAEVVYTPPKPFDRNRLLLQLGIMGAVVLAVFVSLWLFFKVGTVAVSNLGTVDGMSVTGTGRYSIETVVEASGIRPGDSLLGINKPQVSSRIITKLPYIKSVRIGIKLPGTVNIEVEELDVVYSIAEQDGTWWLVTSDGKLVEKTDAARATEFTKILGVHVDMPVAGQNAVAKEQETQTEGETGDTQPPQIVTIPNSQRLETALAILRYLEEGNVMGEVVSVDVTNMGSIELWYGNRFRILLGDSMDMKYKVEMALAAVKQLAEHDRGTLDVSFIVREDVVYTPQSD